MENRWSFRRERAASLAVAAICAALALAWQSATVRANYGGNWSALFCTGGRLTAPPALHDERIHRFANAYGYDGQYYHYIAHDPFLRHGFESYVDAPRLRYRRILVPLVAWMAAAGDPEWIDRAYRAVILAFVFAGSWWLSRFAGSLGLSPLWGAGFLAVPAVAISLDRMTVDIALAAFSVAFALYTAEQRTGRLFAVLALASLTRETGLVPVASACLSELFFRRIGRAALMGSAALPALAWYAYVATHTSGYPAEWMGWPLSGLLPQFLEWKRYQLPAFLAGLVVALDYLALAAVPAAFVAVIALARRSLRRPIELATVIFALLTVFLSRADAWQDVYGFPRTLTPLFLLPALCALERRDWRLAVPLAMVVPRVWAQFAPQLLGVLGR